MKTLVGAIILAVAIAGVVVLNNVTRREDGKSILHVAPELEVTVATARPQQRTIVRTVQAPGEIEPYAEIDISSEIVAKIVEMPVEEGDTVQEGDLLCRLDDADYRARVLSGEAGTARLRAAVTQAEANLDKARRDFDRQKRLSERNATSPIELADYRTALIGMEASLEMRQQELVEAEAMLQSAREDLEKTIIRAPMSGIVSQLLAEKGEVVITGTMNNPGTRIMVISNLEVMQVRCRVDETDAPLVHEDQPARIYLQSDTRQSIPGRVLRVGAKGTKPVGRDVVTFETLVLITGEDERVRPGMTANVEIEVAREEEALTIPVESVVYRKRRDLPVELVERFDARQGEMDASERQHLAEYVKIVFCIDDGKAYPRLAETGINDTISVEIVEGINLDDTVVTGPYRSLDQLKEGTSVKIEEKQKKEAVVDAEKKEATDDSQTTEESPALATSSAE